jgi:hypothetical protein
MVVSMDFEIVDIEKDEETQVIIGHAGFIKSVEDLYEAVASSVPKVRFGIAFCEASGKRLVRSEGNDEALVKLAEKNAMAVGAGHSFIILMKDAYPINVANRIKVVDEVSRVMCATANQVQVAVVKTSKGRAIVGIVDGGQPLGIEGDEDRKERKELLRKIGYKL